ncbi:tetraacyldisaccharide 4'-kinase [Armatimonas sp.]|uniref:tetraacyldisaccharide 4'-kinase n=1 Tax=Armatimonas sp. TaxID=1872638 RepID=UPI003751E503
MDAKALLEEKSLRGALLRLAMTPLSVLHFVGLELYLLPYRLGIRKRNKLPVPVIAIGNLSSGGTGKTPMAALVGRLLREQGLRVVLLSRGHGGSHEKEDGAKIVSRGDGQLLLSADVAGDEPTLLAQLLPDVPVIVGRDRRVSGRLACAEFAPDVILLDDALQFWQLHRDLDIVLLDARRPFDNGWMLPRGLLREPPFHLARAGIVVLTRADRVSSEQLERAKRAVQRFAPRAALFTATHEPTGWVGLDGAQKTLEALTAESAIAFSGIADGQAFRSTLEALKLSLKKFCEFGDHHTYNKEETLALIAQAPQGLFVTTEKDLMRLRALWPAEGPALWALRIQMRVAHDESFSRNLLTFYGRTQENTTQGEPPALPFPSSD